jgi:[ribosomal protein S5]-alanine N-acetyltransferase
MPVSQLWSERLQLRPMQPEDAQAMYAFASDPEIAAMGMWEPLKSLEACRADIEDMLTTEEQGIDWTWAVVLRQEQQMIGMCQLLNYRVQHARTELGYMYNRAYWGKGYATEAASLVVDFAFTRLHVHRVEATVLATNVASIHLLKKIGMQYEGCKREARREKTGFVDLHFYGMLGHEASAG